MFLKKLLFGFGAPEFALPTISKGRAYTQSVDVLQCLCSGMAGTRRLGTHLLGLKASMPTSSYFFFAFFASCFSSSATYSSSSRFLAMLRVLFWNGNVRELSKGERASESREMDPGSGSD